nr:substrate-binding domain-containing protein [Spirochaetaceae bacterium]
MGFIIVDLNVSGYYYNHLLNGAVMACEKLNCDLLIYPGHSLDCPDTHDKEYNSVYSLINTKKIHGLMVSTGSFGIHKIKDRLKIFLNQFNDIPIVSLSVPMDNTYCIEIDNYQGIKNIVGHFITDHNYTIIAYLGGPETNDDALFRFNGYKEALNENNISFDADLYYQGNFTPACARDAVKEFLDIRKVSMDAIVCANDDMAIALINELKKRGFQVPDQIAVSGFDDIMRAEYF